MRGRNNKEICPQDPKNCEASEKLKQQEDIGGKLPEEQPSGGEEEDKGEVRGLWFLIIYGKLVGDSS